MIIDNDRIYQSNTSGPFKIIEDLGFINGRHKCKIKFINTGYEASAITYNATSGRVLDKSLNGQISNDYDITRFDNYDAHINRLLKMIHIHMIDRCNNIFSDHFNAYGEIGIRVSEEWLDVNKFIVDARTLDGFDKYYMRPYIYQLDKDYKQQMIPKNQRIYSRETCMFLYVQDNYNLRVIENMKENGTESNYFGVEVNSAGNYYARIKVNGHRLNIGTFNNPIAANAFNYWELKFHDFELVPLLNNVPYMPPNEFIKYNVNVKEMMTLI